MLLKKLVLYSLRKQCNQLKFVTDIWLPVAVWQQWMPVLPATGMGRNVIRCCYFQKFSAFVQMGNKRKYYLLTERV